MALVNHDEIFVISENVSCEALKHSPLRALPCLAVHSLEHKFQLPYPVPSQLSLLVTVQLLEKVLGPLFLDRGHKPETMGTVVFSSANGARVTMTGITEGVINRMRRSWAVPKLYWEDNIIAVPHQFLAGQCAAVIQASPAVIERWKWWPWDQSTHTPDDIGTRLGVLVNGSGITTSEVGVLLHCV
jgi:hypothetical protein